MGRPCKALDLSAPTTRVTVDLPTDLVAQADVLAAKLNEEVARSSGFAATATRSTALESLLRLGLLARDQRGAHAEREKALQRREAALKHAEGVADSLLSEAQHRARTRRCREEAERRGRRATEDLDARLTATALVILGLLLADGPQTASKLRVQIGRSRSAVARALGGLRDHQLVSRRANPYEASGRTAEGHHRWAPTAWARVLDAE